MIRILWTQKQDAGPGPRGYAAMAYDSSRGRTVLFGGVGAIATNLFADTWEWDGENWTQMGDSGPPALEAAAMAYDVQRNQTVLFGGSGSGGHVNGDTWGWDGRNWTQLADSGAFPRANFAMAYDSKRQRIVVFGGYSGTGTQLADTWEWDGAAWTQLAVTGPAARRGHVMAYDSTRDRSVLFGGLDHTGLNTLGDTWEWNGSVWTQVRDFGTAPCALASLAFKGDSVALFGGVSAWLSVPDVKLYGSTWTWNGGNWTLRQDFAPSPRFAHSMCYDTKRGTLVLFGGVISPQSGPVADTWEHSEGP